MSVLQLFCLSNVNVSKKKESSQKPQTVTFILLKSLIALFIIADVVKAHLIKRGRDVTYNYRTDSGIKKACNASSSSSSLFTLVHFLFPNR